MIIITTFILAEKCNGYACGKSMDEIVTNFYLTFSNKIEELLEKHNKHIVESLVLKKNYKRVRTGYESEQIDDRFEKHSKRKIRQILEKQQLKRYEYEKQLKQIEMQMKVMNKMW